MHTMADLYERNARLYPDREIFVMGQGRRTYVQFLARIRQLAAALEGTGLRHQDRVGLFAANAVEYFEVLGACEYAGLIGAGFNFRSAPPELEYLLENSGARALFFDAATLATVEAVRSLKGEGLQYIYIGADAPGWAISFEDFLARGDPGGPVSRAAPDDFCNLFYTSGTTGRPKGVPYTHRALLITAERSARDEEMSLLQVTPAFHVGGRCPPLGAIWTSGKTVLLPGFEPTQWLETVQSERINVTFMVPMMMQAIIDHPRLSDYDVSSLQWVMAASTAIPPTVLTAAIAALGPVFYVAYGSTETGGVTRLRRSETRADGPPEMTARLASVGHAETPVEIVLLDDDGNRVPPGEIGEICVRSAVFSGYWDNPAATAEAMHGEFLRTGDIGRLDERDYLFIVDRKKDMIISGGENVYSREVEDAMHLHPAVQSAAVIGVPDERWGETVLAVIVLKPGETVDAAALIAFSQTRLARFKCPRRIGFVDALPLLGTGKIDKLMLRSMFATADAGIEA